ncbi:MAG: hypothetical protein ACOY93_20745 [Bacillota bacterium]
MEDLIGFVVFLVFIGLSAVGRMGRNRQEQQGQGRPRYPGPVAGDSIPPWPSPRPQRPQQEPPRQAPPAPAPTAPSRRRPMGGEGVTQEGRAPSLEGRQTEGYGSLEGRALEGVSSMVTGTLAEERSRFRRETERFRRAGPESALRPPEVEEAEAVAEANPLAQVLASKEGLAQAVVLSEVLGKPRALRPFGKR